MGLRTHHRSLRHVNLSHNRIKGAIVEAILKSNNGIEDLDMSNNSLGNEDGVAMARGIAMSKHLKALRLCENKLGTIGVYAIAAAIRNNKTRAGATDVPRLGRKPVGKARGRCDCRIDIRQQFVAGVALEELRAGIPLTDGNR